jgi:hypothetical protein
MTQSDLETAIRDNLNEPDVNGRFSSALITRYMNRAQMKVALAVWWPVGVVPGTWNSNAENPLIEDMLSILRVDVNGQLCVPTSVETMEGQPLEMYDQSGTGQKPEWLALDQAPYPSPATYPVTQTQGVQGFPVPQQPGFPIRPVYYIRGANIGIVPLPASGSTVTIYFIVKPPDLSSTNPNGVSIYPEIFIDAISQKAAEIAMASDKQFQAADYWAGKFKETLFDPQAGLLKWKKQFMQQFVERPQPVTYRALFSGGPITGSGSGGQNIQW